MTVEEKLNMVKTIMGPDAPDDDTIMSYLTLAKTEILQWRFSYNPDDMPDDVPPAYEMTQVYAVVNGWLNTVAVDKIPEFERRLTELMETRYENALISIRQTGKLEEAAEAQLKEALQKLLTEMGG